MSSSVVRQQDEVTTESNFDQVITMAAKIESTRSFLEKYSLISRIMQDHNEFLYKEKHLQKLFSIDSIDVTDLQKRSGKKNGDNRSALQPRLQIVPVRPILLKSMQPEGEDFETRKRNWRDDDNQEGTPR